MKIQLLDSTRWTVEAPGHGPHDAFVPGCVHDALLAARVIPDPDSSGGEAAQAFIGRTDWTWRTTFTADPEVLSRRQVELVFDSIDTIGSVRLNGIHLGDVASQYRPWRFDVRSILRPGANEIEVLLKGSLAEAEQLESVHGARPLNADGAWGPFSQMRKSACNFGWDWGPCCPTCGFAGSVRLEGWEASRITGIRPQVVDLADDRAVVRLDVDVDGPASEASVLVRDEDGAIIARSTGSLVQEFEIENPPIWWPRGLGAQRLVTYEIELEDGTRGSCRSGLRQVELDSGEDGRFAVLVNGEPVFCRGANWIPSRLFPHRQVPDDVEPLLQAACSANMNMLRVWGGGLYEPGWFYDRCDELGIMVWQDFMFACATYPEHREMRSLVEEEARSQVVRLARHPSIVLWCGGNEDVLAWFSWGWKEQMPPDQDWGVGYWTDLLPRVCAELDPARPYWTESPWSGSLERHPNDPDVGDRHTWDLKIDGYRDLVPRFVSEFGHQAPPTLRSIEEALGLDLEVLTPGALEERQRAWGGDEVQYAPYLESWFGITTDQPCSFERWHWAAQVLQARAMSIACTWLRVNRPRCEGALIWQLNDVWTGHSWSLLDVNHRPKPAYHAVQAAFEPLLVALEPVDGELSLVVVNDGPDPVSGTVEVRRLDFHGTPRATCTAAIKLEPRRGRQVVRLPEAIRSIGEGVSELVVAGFDGHRAFWFSSKDRELDCPEPEFEITREDVSTNEIRYTVKARSLLRDLVLQADRLGADARADRGWMTLLPGDAASIVVTGVEPGREPPAPTELFRTANELSS